MFSVNKPESIVWHNSVNNREPPVWNKRTLEEVPECSAFWIVVVVFKINAAIALYIRKSL